MSAWQVRLGGHFGVCLSRPNRAALGDQKCFLRTPYCGGLAPGPTRANWARGRTYNVLFQQNLNHWNPAPAGPIGYISLLLSSTPNVSTSWVEVGRVQDFPGRDMVSQTNFTVPVTVPASLALGAAVLGLQVLSTSSLLLVLHVLAVR
jgi:hypothetical protein